MEKSFDQGQKRPRNGEVIEAKFPSGEWLRVTYCDGGIDGLLEHADGDVTEVEEYWQDMTWKSITDQPEIK